MSQSRRQLPAALSLGSSRDPGFLPLHRVELHVHLEISLRLETIFELLKEKKVPLPGRGTIQDLKTAIQVQTPKDLQHFLSGYQYFIPAIAGDLQAIRRISYEFCEDKSLNGVAYVEVRVWPRVLTSPEVPEVTQEKVVEAVLEGLREGERDFGVKVSAILFCVRKEEQEDATLRLCERFRDQGVVGIDIAGIATCPEDGVVLDPKEVLIFSEAKRLGIRRTVHAGEDGPAQTVKTALTELHAERIGHGYRVVDDRSIYEQCLRDRVHFEACPASSIATGAVNLAQLLRHPIVQFAADSANFSINSDGPTITGASLSDNYDLVRSWGITEADITKANFSALGASFLPEDEKRSLRKKLLATYQNE